MKHKYPWHDDYSIIDSAIENLHLAIESINYAKKIFDEQYTGKADISDAIILIDNLKSALETEVQILMEKLGKTNA